MSDLLDAARQALAALEYMYHTADPGPARDVSMEALDALRTALDARPEPAAWQTQRPVRLTDERMIEIFRASDFVLPTDEWALEVARAVEAEVLRLNGIDTSAERVDSGGEDRHE